MPKKRAQRSQAKQTADAGKSLTAESISPMEARSVPDLPIGEGWQFEPKWDGFRCLAFKFDREVELRGKSGKSLSRYFPEIVESIRRLPHSRLCIDGELVIPEGGRLSFDGLQMRLHPAASRIQKLSVATPALLIAFDCLLDTRGEPLTKATLDIRREVLEKAFAKVPPKSLLRLSPYTRDRRQAQRWLSSAGGFLDGVIAKRLDSPYLSGERAMQKIKRLQTADCVVGGFRYGAGSKQVASLLLGLHDKKGLLHHVGFTSSIAAADRAALTRRLEKLIGPPGFTGNAPGGPSRWSTERSADWQPLKSRLVVEVCYDHVTAGRFRHGTRLMRWRPDKAPEQCSCEQIRPMAKPSSLLKEILEQ